MDESDIKELIAMLTDAIADKNWDGVYEVKDYLYEFIDTPGVGTEE